MAVYREGYAWLKKLHDNSVQIFPDAADFGVPIKRNDKFWNIAKALVEWYGIKGTRKYNKYSTGKSVEYTIELIDEWAVSDGYKNITEATENWSVSYITCSSGRCKDMDGYIQVYRLD
jgi:hypothetical protein